MERAKSLTVTMKLQSLASAPRHIFETYTSNTRSSMMQSWDWRLWHGKLIANTIPVGKRSVEPWSCALSFDELTHLRLQTAVERLQKLTKMRQGSRGWWQSWTPILHQIYYLMRPIKNIARTCWREGRRQVLAKALIWWQVCSGGALM